MAEVEEAPATSPEGAQTMASLMRSVHLLSSRKILKCLSLVLETQMLELLKKTTITVRVCLQLRKIEATEVMIIPREKMVMLRSVNHLATVLQTVEAPTMVLLFVEALMTTQKTMKKKGIGGETVVLALVVVAPTVAVLEEARDLVNAEMTVVSQKETVVPLLRCT